MFDEWTLKQMREAMMDDPSVFYPKATIHREMPNVRAIGDIIANGADLVPHVKIMTDHYLKISEAMIAAASALPKHAWESNAATTATDPTAEPPGLTLEALEAALEAARPCVRYKATEHLPAVDVLGKPVFYGIDEALILFHPDNLGLAQAWAKSQGVTLVEVGPGELLEARGLKVKPFKP